MKPGPVTKLNKRNKKEDLKKIDNDTMLTNRDITVIFTTYGQFTAILKPDSGRIVYKTYISLIVTLHFLKSTNRSLT